MKEEITIDGVKYKLVKVVEVEKRHIPKEKIYCEVNEVGTITLGDINFITPNKQGLAILTLFNKLRPGDVISIQFEEGR